LIHGSIFSFPCGSLSFYRKIGKFINRLCSDFSSTPLFWTIHGYKSCGKINQSSYLKYARLLKNAGADTFIQNIDGYTVLHLLEKGDAEFFKLL
jgi:hypothetical protein